MADPWAAFRIPADQSEGFQATPRGFTVNDVQAAVRGDMFNAPGLPIKYAAQPGQIFGQSATANAQPFSGVVAHHTGGPTLRGALDTAQRGDPFRGGLKAGYHFYIDTDGSVVQGAPMDARTNHVQPPNSPQRTARPDISNNNAIGVSFVGSGNPNQAQLTAAVNLTRALQSNYGISPGNIVGHGEIQNSRQPTEGMPLVSAIRTPTDVSAQRRPDADPWAVFRIKEDRAPTRITVNALPVAERFGEMQAPAQGGTALRERLNQRGLEMTRRPQLSPSAQMAGEMANLVPAASQGTNPHISNYGGKLVSTEAFEDDGGNVLYRDPQTGQIKPTNRDTHVALRDPADGVVKVFERSEATDEGPMTGVSRVLAPGLAAGAPTGRLGSAAVSNADKIVPRASETFSTAKPFYRAFDQEAGNIQVPAGAASQIVNRVHGAMESGKVPRHLAEEAYQSVEEISRGVAPRELPYWQRVEAEMNGLPTTTPGKPIALDHLRDVKELVGQSSRSVDPRVRQGAGIAGREINRVISEVSPTAGANLQKADAIHATAKSQQELQRKGEIAGLRTGRAGYGGNAVNNYRQVLSPIVEKAIKGETTGFKPNEIAAIREIVEGTRATNALRLVGQLSPSKGAISTFGGIANLGAGVSTLGASWVAGGAANKLATILTEGQINRLNQLVAKRSPAYQAAVEKAADRFIKAQMEFAEKPSPNKLAAYVGASRALSSGLQRDGITVTSGDLIKSLTGPIKTAADEDQAPVQGPSGQQ